MRERVQKFLSNQGITSRRKAEELIASGRVKVNGKIIRLGDGIDPETDTIEVSGKPLSTMQAQKVYIVLNKPKGYVVSKSDPQNRKTVFSLLPTELRDKVWNVGRLDYNTEGLLLLTNDGELTQRLAHPKFEHEKEYEVTTNVAANDEQLGKLRSGVDIATGTTYPAKVKSRNNILYITIHEGKKRQIRRMIEAVDLKVKNLKRIRINKLMLPNIAVGKYSLVKKTDIL